MHLTRQAGIKLPDQFQVKQNLINIELLLQNTKATIGTKLFYDLTCDYLNACIKTEYDLKLDPKDKDLALQIF